MPTTTAKNQARKANRSTRDAALQAGRGVRTLVRDTAYATVGAGDTALAYARQLNEKVAELRAQAPSTLRGVTRPRDLTVSVQTLAEGAEKEFNELAARGRGVVERVQRSRPARTAAEQGRAAGSDTKAAVTSIRKAADTGASAANTGAKAAREVTEKLGDRSPVDYAGYTVEELREMARVRDIEGRSDMNKDELVQALQKA